jgi:peptidoglycan hydrolase CwlO-like protein
MLKETLELGRMRNGDAALRFSIVVAVASFIALTAGLYEIDRREKSTSATRERSLSEIEQRLQVLGDQIHILNNQLTAQMAANERQLQTLNSEVQALSHKYESRLKELEDALHVHR